MDKFRLCKVYNLYIGVMQRKGIEEKLELAELFAIYGKLLPEKQQDFMQLHCFDDLSLTEIGSEHNISRQAAYDAIKQAKRNLTKYEEVLGLYRRSREKSEKLPEPLEELLSEIKTRLRFVPVYDVEELLEKVRQLEQHMRDNL